MPDWTVATWPIAQAGVQQAAGPEESEEGGKIDYHRVPDSKRDLIHGGIRRCRRWRTAATTPTKHVGVQDLPRRGYLGSYETLSYVDRYIRARRRFAAGLRSCLASPQGGTCSNAYMDHVLLQYT